MANIAVQRIKREFKEVLKSEEGSCNDSPHGIIVIASTIGSCRAR
ncbi:UBE2K isoform 5 [Pan troglodytes]|uniref:Ubiquitin conjugating enzyme E2 K n=3 Tax=Hominidae TaxID=9604 RepID=D6RFX1_HUMAN|nr:UBE2K isoform 5 [Pan troglodytes]PNJ30857.1 UBE2K isoform 7 [Pongo abelii]